MKIDFDFFPFIGIVVDIDGNKKSLFSCRPGSLGIRTSNECPSPLTGYDAGLDVETVTSSASLVVMTAEDDVSQVSYIHPVPQNVVPSLAVAPLK